MPVPTLNPDVTEDTLEPNARARGHARGRLDGLRRLTRPYRTIDPLFGEVVYASAQEEAKSLAPTLASQQGYLSTREIQSFAWGYREGFQKAFLPQTREEAIQAIVDIDVIRWGEQERELSQKTHAFRSYGLALCELAARATEGTPETRTIEIAAELALTPEDRRWLRGVGS